jgi:ATP-dependent helicase/nuclease subunit A
MSGGSIELRDAGVRRLAQTEFVSPLLIEAGAGTGKTSLLVARLVAWCVGPGWRLHAVEGESLTTIARNVIERMVAITFTEAAAAEMAQRVGEALSDLVRGTRLPVGFESEALEVSGSELEARAAALADESHRLQAQTIHSWCHRLLRAFPLEAGLHPHFEVDADGSRVEQLADEVVEENLRDPAANRTDAAWGVLAAAGVQPPRVAEALREIVAAGVTADELRRDPFAAEIVAEMASRLGGFFGAFWKIEDGALLEVKRAPVTAAAREALAEFSGRLERLGDEPTIDELLWAAEPLGEAEIERLTKWAKGDFNQGERRALGDSETACAEAARQLVLLIRGLARFEPELLAAARELLAGMLGELRERMRRNGVVTFGDLLDSTARLVEGDARVRSELRRGIDQLLVDEFQDTDSVQCRIVRRLALDGPEDSRPGLFVVGDPKQSIFGWRRADLAAYDAFVEVLKSAGGTVHPLVSNFRSVWPILDEVERVVDPIMEQETGVQPPFEALEATEERRVETGFAGGGRCAVEHWVAWPPKPDSGELDAGAATDTMLELEAATLAADIRDLNENAGVQWGQIAVLLRTTTKQETILDHFRAAGVPFEVAREREYYRHREVVEAAALVRCVLEPGDMVALLTLLRSDAVGVPDAALVPLWDAELPSLLAGIQGAESRTLEALDRCLERAAAVIPDGLPGADELPNWPLAVRSAAEILGVLRASVRTDPPDLFIERLRTLWLAEVTASARYLGRFRRSRLERFFAQLERTLVSSDGSLAPVARFLRRAVEEGREGEIQAEPDMSADAVHVMTIHGAKGLDFDHVYLTQIQRPTRKGRHEPAAVVQRSVDRLCYSLFGWPTPGFIEAENSREARERAERVRLLYVAMTRAKERLVVSGGWRDHGELVDAPRAASFADLLAHRVDSEALQAQVKQWSPRFEEPGTHVQWVLPACDTACTEAESPGDFAPPIDLDRVSEDAERLRRLRIEADERAGQPLTASVSGFAHFELETDGPGAAETGDEVREVAMAVGSALHALLESFDLGAELAPQLDSRRQWLEARLAVALSPDRLDSGLQHASTLLERLADGRCLNRLQELADQVLARELPLLLPADEGTVATIVGTADLVYRDNGRLVVADYKTDAIAEHELDARVEIYRPQLALYARALSEALELPEPPLMELWFLSADRIVRLN